MKIQIILKNLGHNQCLDWQPFGALAAWHRVRIRVRGRAVRIRNIFLLNRGSEQVKTVETGTYADPEIVSAAMV
jgi:hypothetical protein